MKEKLSCSIYFRETETTVADLERLASALTLEDEEITQTELNRRARELFRKALRAELTLRGLSPRS